MGSEPRSVSVSIGYTGRTSFEANCYGLVGIFPYIDVDLRCRVSPCRGYNTMVFDLAPFSQQRFGIGLEPVQKWLS
jgi:hypothetical protein